MPAIKARWRWAAKEVEDGTDSDGVGVQEEENTQIFLFISKNVNKRMINEPFGFYDWETDGTRVAHTK